LQETKFWEGDCTKEAAVTSGLVWAILGPARVVTQSDISLLAYWDEGELILARRVFLNVFRSRKRGHNSEAKSVERHAGSFIDVIRLMERRSLGI
jgi:hypothetical protein